MPAGSGRSATSAGTSPTQSSPEAPIPRVERSLSVGSPSVLIAVALFMLANALAAANWFILLTGSGVVLLLVVRTRREEERLLRRFGEPYRAYVERTGRFLPRLGSRL